MSNYHYFQILPRSQVDEIVKMRVNSRKELEMRKAKFDDLQSKIKRYVLN